MKIFKKIKKIITALIVSVAVFFSGQVFLPANFSHVKAEVLTYTDVLDDLKQDNSFDVSKYPVLSSTKIEELNSNDNLDDDIDYISIIHIGEGVNRDFFIYTYQPLNTTYDLTASSINMSYGEGSEIYKKYKLKCVSSNGVFKKYYVEDFEVSNDLYRFYNIAEIERPFDTLLDYKISDVTYIDYTASKVGQTWCCYYSDNNLVYEMVTLEVVELKPTLTDFIYCADGITWGNLVGISSGCNAHYIAFNVDNYDIDKIIDASMTYRIRSSTTIHTIKSGVLNGIAGLFGADNDTTSTYLKDDEIDISFELTKDDIATNNGQGLFAKQYKWNRIMSASDFLTNLDKQGVIFSESVINTLNNSQFVFAFAETNVTYYSYNTFNPDSIIDWNSETTTVISGKKVDNVDILRLKFQVGHEVYNLGVVSDTTSGDNIPGGVGSGLDLEKVEDFLIKILAVLALVLISVFIGPFISPIIMIIFNLLSKLISMILKLFALGFKFIWLILTFPFRLLKPK